MRENIGTTRSPLCSAVFLRTTLAVASAAFTAMNSCAAAVLPRDLGVVSPSSPMSAVVWLKAGSDSALDVALAALNDADSPSYHRWLSDADIAALAPSAEDLANARASLVAQGLKVEKVFDGGRFVRVSGSAAQIQHAFSTVVHTVQDEAGQSSYKAVVTPVYKGAHAELVGGVTGLNGVKSKPFLARQTDITTGAVAAAHVLMAGVDPLGGFTTDCFGPSRKLVVQGFSQGSLTVPPGVVNATYNAPTYLDPTTLAGRPSCGYTASRLVQHYGIDQAHALGLRGRGQTIVIVDAYGSSTALSDLNVYSKVMGLPTMGAKNFEVIYPDGVPTASDADWSSETALDIELAHAFAPEAKIVLVIAPNAEDAELAYAVEYAAVHHLGNVISNSWGASEAGDDKSSADLFDHTFKIAAALGVAVNVATGDDGDYKLGTPVGAPSVPADSQYATAVGGTSINVPSVFGPVESAWGLTVSDLGTDRNPNSVPAMQGMRQGSGGGESVFVRKPRFQKDLPGSGRQTPDISALADPQTGAIYFETSLLTGQPSWSVIGGTSLATPIFSAVWALSDEAAGESLGQAAPLLSKLPKFAIRDVLPIVVRPNSVNASITFRETTTTTYDAAQLLGLDKTQPKGFFSAIVYSGVSPFERHLALGFGADSSLMATPGWDNATGYGVPNGLLFIESARLFGRAR